MNRIDPIIHTKLRPPFTRRSLVSRPRLQDEIAQGLFSPLTLVTGPAGFGKTTLVAASLAGSNLPVAWLSLDKDDNQVERFLSYLVAALQETDHTIGSRAVQLLAAAHQAPPEAVLVSLINDMDTASREIVLVLDDYQFIFSQTVHDEVAFLLEHCPRTFHLVIATRSNPPLPLNRLRARGQMVELRAADLRFTEPEAAQFLNEVMGLELDDRSISDLEERTEGWIAGLQMAALSMRDREDVSGFIEGFSGTNRYILDYLLEEVLASQPSEIQHFLLCTSILKRLTAPLCDAILLNSDGQIFEGSDWSIGSELRSGNRSASLLEYVERANLFLVSLDDERIWYRYHHLFADLLRKQLQKTLGAQAITHLNIRASEWHAQNGFILEAIHYASVASDDELVEHLIEKNYMEMMNRGEMTWIRYWMGRLSKEQICQRPWLCLYEAMNHCWFGQLDEATSLLNEAEKRIRATTPSSDTQAMLGYHAYVKSRVTAMQGDTRKAIELCLTARRYIPEDNLALHIDISITLGYEYFLYGEFENASQILLAMIRSSYPAGAVNNPVAAYAVLARMRGYQGQLSQAYELLQRAGQLIDEPGRQYLGVTGLLDVEMAALLCEWNNLDTALDRLEHGLELLPMWGKADDLCLAYTTLARIQHGRGNLVDAASTIEKAVQLLHTGGVFSEARNAVDAAQVRLWLAQGEWASIDSWADAHETQFGSYDLVGYEDELTLITLVRVFIAQNKPEKAIRLLSRLEEFARSSGRAGRLIEIMILKALAMQRTGDAKQADIALMECLELAEPERYVRIYLDEGQPMQLLLARWLAHASDGPLRVFAARLLSQFGAEPKPVSEAQASTSLIGSLSASPGQALVEPLSQRELEVLQHIALGKTNQEIARQLIISPGTVKAHTASIYRKLDVANRTEAVARARQLGILP